MTVLIRLAADLDRLFQEKGWKYCIIGGLALQRWGQMRMTLDVDITLLTGLGHEEAYIDELLGHYQARIPEAKEFAFANRVLLLKSPEGIGIDVALAGLPFEETVIERASRFEFAAGVSALTCSAEDLVILKAFADRGQDWLDIEGILVRQKGKLDRVYIETRLESLCELKEAPEILDRLRGAFERLE